jgi:methyl-accepting chemotaxis protein
MTKEHPDLSDPTNAPQAAEEFHDANAVTELEAARRQIAMQQSAMVGTRNLLITCDTDFNIAFVNGAAIRNLKRRQDDLRQVDPSFDPENLVGNPADIFYADPERARQLLTDPKNMPYIEELSVGEAVLDMATTALTDEEGNWCGNLIEWNDLTEQRDALRQIRNVIDGAVNGELDRRLKTDRYEGGMRDLGDSVNELMDAVVEPTRASMRVMQELAQGDLTARMHGQFDGEFGELRDAINATAQRLQDVVTRIRDYAHTIGSSAAEISQGNTDLSQRTEEQAANLEETASSMEEFASTISQTADNAVKASQLADGARDKAAKGGSVVRDAVEAMSEINEASTKIADIIGVIDEIAFQTNLLALNAAVEAARAGEHGRGFAVVAQEVRNLAQRSATAAKEIKALIKDSVRKVEDGTDLVNASGETLDEIVQAVKQVNDIISEIAAASQQQSAGVEQINQAVAQLDEVTQQNAALVEETAAASVSASDTVGELQRLVEFFNVGNVAGQQGQLQPGLENGHGNGNGYVNGHGHGLGHGNGHDRGRVNGNGHAPVMTPPSSAEDQNNWNEF